MDINEYRHLAPEERVQFWKGLMQGCVPRGEVKETAAAAGCADFILYKLRNEDLLESYFPVHPAVPLALAHTGKLCLLDAFEELFGRVAFRLPKPGMTAQEVSREISRAVAAFGSLLEEMGDALEMESPGGGAITPEEYRDIAQAADVAVARILALKEAARLARGGKVVKGEEFQVRFGGEEG